ncbi:NAD-dependent epimerase/dehydratase family protein, partial [Pseudomonas juntendi]|uniref:NAD-dependent epimerase/dehydratase family protein n=1 Tax=Pseudomonas juntendi TaxID=2666183 RepID=UPI00301DD5A3
MPYWPARKSFIPLASSRVPGAPACRPYWTVSTAMADAPILITGGAGFIGSHLCDALLDKGYAVRILDDLSTGRRDNLQIDHPRLELIEG